MQRHKKRIKDRQKNEKKERKNYIRKKGFDYQKSNKDDTENIRKNIKNKYNI